MRPRPTLPSTRRALRPRVRFAAGHAQAIPVVSGRRAILAVAAVLAMAVAVAATPGAVRGQASGTVRGETSVPPEAIATPESAAALFLRSVRAIRWSAVAQVMDPETLDRVRTTVTMIADADQTGDVRAYLVQTDSAGLVALEAATVFDRSIGAVIDDMPGLMHSLYDRDDEVLGHVAEGGDEAHVVYRTTARISGAVPEVKVMQMRRGPAGWRVAWSDELEVLEAALRGVPRGR